MCSVMQLLAGRGRVTLLTRVDRPSGGCLILVALLLLLATSGLSGEATSYTELPGGTVDGKRLIVSDSPYLLTGNLRVLNLTIDPGVTVEAAGEFEIIVEGMMKAIGTDTDSIRFTVTDTVSSWKGLYFHQSFPGCELAYCHIDHSNSSGIRIENASPVIRNSTIANNTAPDGGGIKITGPLAVTLTECVIRANGHVGQVRARGGAVFTTSATTLIRCVLVDNCIIDDRLPCRSGHSGRTEGGAIWSSDELALYSVKVLHNVAQAHGHYEQSYGGGVYCTGPLRLENCTIAYNLAWAGGCNYGGTVARGGGVYATSTIDIRNSIFVGNGARHAGGGLYARSTAHGSIVNSTLAYDNRPGAITVDGSGVWMSNSIVYFNPFPQILGALSTSYSNVEGGREGLGNIAEHPLFVLHEDNPSDLMIPANSPCIDAGDPDPIYNDVCFPPSLGTARNDMGAHGGPGACGWDCPTDGPPRVPSMLRASSSGREVELTWDANCEADLLEYRLFRRGGSSGEEFLAAVPVGTESYLDLDVVCHVNYWYRIKAVDDSMNVSGLSAEVSVRACDDIDAVEITCPEVTEGFVLCDLDTELCMPLPISNAATVEVDGATWDDNQLCFTPDSPGLYSFTVIATNEAGSDTCEVEVVVEHTPPPVACFVAQPASGTAPLNVAFSNCSTPADVVECLWDFGEGSTSALFEPEHTFADVGSYTVSLTVTNDCGVHTTESVVEVREAGRAILSFSPDSLELHPPVLDIPGTVKLMVDSTEPVMGVTAEVHYDPSRVHIISLTTGPFLGRNGGQVTSHSSHNNDSGVLSVSMAVMGGNPIGVSGGGSLLSIELVAVTEDPTSSLAFVSSTLRDPGNAAIPTDMVDGEIIKACALLGDLNRDGLIDFKDFTHFVWCWNEFPGQTCADLCGPVTGPAPAPPPWTVCSYPYPPDGLVNFEDLMGFVQMYNWSGGYGKSATGGEEHRLAGVTPMAAVLSAAGRSGSVSDGVVGVSLEVPGVADAIGWRFELEFDRGALRLIGTSLDEALDLEGNHVVVLDRLHDDRVEINRAVLGVRPDPAHGAQTVEFWFECLGEVEETEVTLVRAEVRCAAGGRHVVDTGDDGVSLSLRTGGSGLTLPARVMLRQNTPNPFAGGTVIRFDLPHAMQAELTVYDVQGRRVRNLASGVHGAGFHEKPWDGRDDLGIPSAAGIYFYRLTTEGDTETKRMLLTR